MRVYGGHALLRWAGCGWGSQSKSQKRVFSFDPYSHDPPFPPLPGSVGLDAHLLLSSCRFLVSVSLFLNSASLLLASSSLLRTPSLQVNMDGGHDAAHAGLHCHGENRRLVVIRGLDTFPVQAGTDVFLGSHAVAQLVAQAAQLTWSWMLSKSADMYFLWSETDGRPRTPCGCTCHPGEWEEAGGGIPTGRRILVPDGM